MVQHRFEPQKKSRIEYSKASTRTPTLNLSIGTFALLQSALATVQELGEDFQKPSWGKTTQFRPVSRRSQFVACAKSNHDFTHGRWVHERSVSRGSVFLDFENIRSELFDFVCRELRFSIFSVNKGHRKLSYVKSPPASLPYGFYLYFVGLTVQVWNHFLDKSC